jgi:hypothetical protein
LAPLSAEDAAEINQELNKTQELIKSADFFRGTTMIFGNNFVLCLIFFIPILGFIFGFSVLYTTGVIIAAESASIGVHPLVGLFSLFIFPFTWLEFLAYSMAFSQSIWLMYRTIKHAWKKELINTSIIISICAVTLLVAAAIEMAIIQAITMAI